MSCYLSSDELYKALRNDLHLMLDAYLSMKSERDELLAIVEERGKLWAHEEDSYALDASRLAIKLSETESERDKYKAIVEADTTAFNKMLKMDYSKGGIMQSIAKIALALREKER